MSEKRDIQFLEDILKAAELISDFKGNISYEEFLKDEKTKAAIVRNLEIIGEASKNISEAVQQQNKEIPWKEMARMRDKLIHHYFGINYDIVWAVITSDIPDLIDKIKTII